MLSVFLISSFFSLNIRKVAYFNDAKDLIPIASQAGLEPIIQKNILSISESSLRKGYLNNHGYRYTEEIKKVLKNCLGSNV